MLNPWTLSSQSNKQLGVDTRAGRVGEPIYPWTLPIRTLLIEAWRNDALYMKTQPGYNSTQLHKAVGESSMFLNYAIWDSVADFRAAFAKPEFQNALGHYPSSAVTAPHLFEKIAVPNCCHRLRRL